MLRVAGRSIRLSRLHDQLTSGKRRTAVGLWTWYGRLAAIPAFLIGFTPVSMFMMFGNVLNSLATYAQDSTFDPLIPIRDYSLLFSVPFHLFRLPQLSDLIQLDPPRIAIHDLIAVRHVRPHDGEWSCIL
jgi:hypothetical protein